MGQHGGTGWWPVIFAMLALFCPCLEKVYISFPRIIYSPKTIQVFHFIVFLTSLATLAAYKAPTQDHGQLLTLTPTLLLYKHSNLPPVAHATGQILWTHRPFTFLEYWWPTQARSLASSQDPSAHLVPISNIVCPYAPAGTSWPHIHLPDVNVYPLSPHRFMQTRRSWWSSSLQRRVMISQFDLPVSAPNLLGRSAFGANLTHASNNLRPFALVETSWPHKHPSDVNVKNHSPHLSIQTRLFVCKFSPQKGKIIPILSSTKLLTLYFTIREPRSHVSRDSEFHLSVVFSEATILPANQRRGSHFYFLTADWPPTWRTPTDWPRHCHHYPPSIGDPQHYPPSIGDPRLITDPLLKKCRQTENFKCRSMAYCDCRLTETFQLPFNGNFKIAV